MSNVFSRASLAAVSRRERFGFILGVALILAAWPAGRVGWLSNTLTGLGIAVIAAIVAKVVRDLRTRNSLGKSDVDRGVVVYDRRARYTELLGRIAKAGEVDLIGMSLAYALDHLRDNRRDFFRRVDKVRILLPGSKELCDERDRAQNGAPGTLWQAVRDQTATVQLLLHEYPNSVEVRYFTMQSYCAMTRIDDTIWAAPYITKGGGSSPLLVMSDSRSAHLFELYREHFERIWEDSDPHGVNVLPLTEAA